ncbi:MAG: ABC transporter permease, partial [Acidobacteriota bacterium]
MAPGYLGIQGIPLQSGRGLSDSDSMGSMPVVLINEQMARQHWPGGNPVGNRLKVGGEEITNEWLTIVGVVADTRLRSGPDESASPLVYVPFSQNTRRSMALVTRPRGD